MFLSLCLTVFKYEHLTLIPLNIAPVIVTKYLSLFVFYFFMLSIKLFSKRHSGCSLAPTSSLMKICGLWEEMTNFNEIFDLEKG